MNYFELKTVGNLLYLGNFVVHSNFKNVINFVNKKNELVSISNSEKYLYANAIILYNIDIHSVSQIEITENELILNNKVFETRNLEKYNSFFDFNEKIQIQRIIDLFKHKCLKKLHKKSLAFLLNSENEKHFTSSFEKAYVNYFKSAYNEYFFTDIFQFIKKIKGAGFGLTPSGDDFISGFLYACNMLQVIENKDLKKIIEKTVEISLGENLISNTEIYFASKGAYFKRLKDFLNTLFFDENKIYESFYELLEIGETSSSDILTGYFLTLMNYKKILNYTKPLSFFLI